MPRVGGQAVIRMTIPYNRGDFSDAGVARAEKPLLSLHEPVKV